MSPRFDPYHKWLGIAPHEQPPHHYRLLGVSLYEQDPEVIERAADQRMAYLRTLQSGKQVAESQRLLNEASAASSCLLDPETKAAYDSRLRSRINATTETPISATPPPTHPPVTPPAPRPSRTIAPAVAPPDDRPRALPNQNAVPSLPTVPVGPPLSAPPVVPTLPTVPTKPPAPPPTSFLSDGSPPILTFPVDPPPVLPRGIPTPMPAGRPPFGGPTASPSALRERAEEYKTNFAELRAQKKYSEASELLRALAAVRNPDLAEYADWARREQVRLDAEIEQTRRESETARPAAAHEPEKAKPPRAERQRSSWSSLATTLGIWLAVLGLAALATAIFANGWLLNREPVFGPLEDRTCIPGTAIEFRVQATDPDEPRDQLTYSLVEGPPGATLDATTGEFRWVAWGNDLANEFPVTIQVTDNGLPPRKAQASFRITMQVPVGAPMP